MGRWSIRTFVPMWLLLAISLLLGASAGAVLVLRWAGVQCLGPSELGKRYGRESDYMLEDHRVPPLIRALGLGDTARAHALIAAGARVNVADPYGLTPLMVVVTDAKVAVPELLAAGALVNAKERVKGQAALFLAAQIGDVAVAQELVRCGADVNAKSIYGETRLKLAAASCRTLLAS